MNSTNKIESRRRRLWERARRRSPEPNAIRWQSDGSRLLFGIATFLPALLLGMILSSPETASNAAFGVLTLLWSALIALFLSGYVLKSRNVTDVGRIGWIASFVLLGPIAFPAFWLVHIWSGPRMKVMPGSRFEVEKRQYIMPDYAGRMEPRN